MRSLVDVINQLVAAEPSLEEHLKHIRSQCVFTAPECMPDRWRDAAIILATHVPNRDDLREIFSGSTLRPVST